MASDKQKVLRCAIYTRKSTEHGLELEFNSLDAQREACESYIKSQASIGWRLLPKRYDDAAYSGGTLNRPAVKRLLKDIEAGLVDVVVVYKIDHLTRALADFAKLVELFDAHSVSFVAVTQQFNTTTSMGRLTLNVLLSFAQFERELASERVRDKIAASRRKGKWTGGSVPLGYDSIGKKLVVNVKEADTVRMIFKRYLAFRSVPKLIAELDRNRVVTKRRRVKGKTVGGVPFNYGSLIYLLKNRTYLGEVRHGRHRYAGEHQPIIPTELFERVQALLKANSVRRTNERHANRALLTGLLFDDRSNRMSPTYTVKRGVRYPSYVSAAALRGHKNEAGSVVRTPAAEIEAVVTKALQGIVPAEAGSQAEDNDRALIDQHVERIVLGAKKISLMLKSKRKPIELPWTPRNGQGVIKVIEPDAAGERAPKQELMQAIVRAHAWLTALTDGSHSTVDSLARAANLHPKVIRKNIRLAFLAPDITASIFEGSQAATANLRQLQETFDVSWARQRAKRTDLS